MDERPSGESLPTSQRLSPDGGIVYQPSDQWAKVPEEAAYAGLDATAWNVLVILSAKAGRERTAWMSQRTIGERLGLEWTTISRAIRRLEKSDLIRDAGKVVVDREAGTWVRRYKVAPYLPEVHPASHRYMPFDLPDVRPERTAGADIARPDVRLGRPDVRLEGPDVRLELPDVRPGITHSVPQYSVPQISDAQFDEMKNENQDQNRQTQRLSEEGRRIVEDLIVRGTDRAEIDQRLQVLAVHDQDQADGWDHALQTLIRCDVDPAEATLILAKAHIDGRDPAEVIGPVQAAAPFGRWQRSRNDEARSESLPPLRQGARTRLGPAERGGTTPITSAGVRSWPGRQGPGSVGGVAV
jgi:DNA-binding Lrp family transcriptional regulator